MRMHQWALALILFTLACCTWLTAEEAVAAVTAVGDSGPAWLNTLMALLASIVTVFLLPLIKNKAAAAKEQAAQFSYDKTTSIMQQKDYLLNARVTPFLWDTAAYLTEVRLPQWLDRIGRKDFDSIWTDLVAELKDLAIKKFAAEGIDLIQVFGADALTTLIKTAVMEKLPIPNGVKEPATYLLDKVAPKLIEHGVEWVRDRIIAGDTQLAGAAPAPVPGPVNG